ncbi:alpha/beta fold hydrolase [Roseateles asaccharophilus]|uniref:Pimeloyl-ACP methyl ester carboxylesterase n=1 Tax=Roseateles asaccharophilus TaxID=582607 RepID=A0ABU2A9X0_9BURK|nr:alpha/beta fold hydrolase [Roseateles asaccharophilus]MDR7333267.1 pimeloyl-ACP methyl ester carboxylesterase [Roseateles asaccharophilus]
MPASRSPRTPRRSTTPTPSSHDWADLRAPNAWLLMLEGRAPWEYAALLAALPWMKKLPKGDGHPVLVFPGLGANDLTTAPLRALLDSLGYSTQPWGQGFNFGPRAGVLEKIEADLVDLHRRHGGRKVSLLGWSLGGIYARELAKMRPELVRCVVTLGTPFTGHPRATNAWRFFELVSGQTVADDHELLAQIRQAPPVPTTSIYSKSDGVVAWRCSVNEPSPLAENIEVQASHIGLGVNPIALYALADRLAQPEGDWKPFEPKGARRWFYKT